jgi:hypothetical protein
MVTPLLRELAGPFLPFIPLEHARQVSDSWARVCRQAIQSGNAEQLHATRDDYRTFLLAHLKILDGWLVLLNRFPQEYPPGFAQDFASIREQLQKHHDSLFPRWQTLEDLEAILLERVSLPNDQLKELAAKYPPPQAWYDEDNSPTPSQE